MALVTLPVFYVDNRITRFDGFLLFTYFVAYNVHVVFRAMQNPALGSLHTFLLVYVPLTFALIVGLAIQHARQRKAVA